jgi:hypothetical protein
VNALVWFWLIDETYWTNLWLSMWISKGGPSQVMELDGCHRDIGDDQKMDQVLYFGKEEREKQNPMELEAEV